jgi:hypothetical protein
MELYTLMPRVIKCDFFHAVKEVVHRAARERAISTREKSRTLPVAYNILCYPAELFLAS